MQNTADNVYEQQVAPFKLHFTYTTRYFSISSTARFSVRPTTAHLIAIAPFSSCSCVSWDKISFPSRFPHDYDDPALFPAILCDRDKSAWVPISYYTVVVFSACAKYNVRMRATIILTNNHTGQQFNTGPAVLSSRRSKINKNHEVQGSKRAVVTNNNNICIKYFGSRVTVVWLFPLVSFDLQSAVFQNYCGSFIGRIDFYHLEIDYSGGCHFESRSNLFIVV